MSRKEKEKLLALKRERKLRGSKEEFWTFCKTLSPDFYKEDRWHLKLLAWVLQALYERRLTKEDFYNFCVEHVPDGFMKMFDFDRLKEDKIYTRLMMNEPPRHGKSRTLINFCKWALGDEPSNKIITCSYNDDMATDFSRYTRDGINEDKTYPHEIVYNDIFPESKIKQGNASYHQWALEGQFFNYKGAGVGGSITGKGCNISIVDDPVKDAEAALNENALDKIWTWYTGTFLSRKEEGAIDIVNMTRWAKKDICGRLLDGPEADEWFVLKLEAKDEDGNMLCPELLSNKSYKSLRANMVPEIFQANYHQKPIDQKGKLYKSFKTYTDLPRSNQGKPMMDRIISYTDTADTGSDYLCTLAAVEYAGEAYVIDIMYTKAGMEVTEPDTADFLVANKVNLAKIESNNGGRGFARNVKRLIWERHRTKKVNIDWFHQSQNKKARIISNSTFVMNHIYFPYNWRERWPKYYEAMNSYQKEGKNKNDDGPDATTGLAEMINNGQGYSISNLFN